MTVVVALGGNALARRGDAPDVEVQRRRIEAAASAIAVIAREGGVVVTHGNGPQVGQLAIQHEGLGDIGAHPLDVLDAESEGMIGYLLEQELGRVLPADRIATVLTQVVVDPEDPAFAHATKPIGPVFDQAEGLRVATERGWTMAPDGAGLRRVVPSPQPLDIVELRAIRLLLDAGVLVITGGGGGIPVAARATGGYVGVEAVIDKDLTAALLAARLEARALLLLTDVDAVYDGYGTDRAVAIRRGGVDALRRLSLAAGSMGPKVEAACRFAEQGGRALIGSLDEVDGLLAGATGTEVVAGSHPLELAGHG